jgi:hypothetical protein
MKLGWGLLLLLCAQRARAQDVDQIVARVLMVRGGEAKIRAIRTERLTGRIALGGETGTLRVEIARPSSIREEFISGPDAVARPTDGQTGWVRIGDGEVKPLLAEDVRTMIASADLDGPLLDYKAKGTRIEYAGLADVDGGKAFKLIVHLKDGTTRTDYINNQTYLEVKWEGTLQTGGKLYSVESYFRDYREVDGIQCAFRIESNTLGTPVKQKLMFDRIEINPPIPPERFKKP